MKIEMSGLIFTTAVQEPFPNFVLLLTRRHLKTVCKKAFDAKSRGRCKNQVKNILDSLINGSTQEKIP